MIKIRFLVAKILISLLFILLLFLGFWQLDRAEQKRVIENAIITAQQQPLVLINNASELPNKQYHKVLLTGTYDISKQIIYDNQTVDKVAGYNVLTPFILDNSTAVILVNRGFIAWQGERKLAKIDFVAGRVTIQVEIIKPVQRFQLKQLELRAEFPLIVQSIDINKLSAITDYNLVNMIARLAKDDDNGFVRNWQPFYGSVDKHMGYAIQWFLMAFTLILISLFLLKKHSATNKNKC